MSQHALTADEIRSFHESGVAGPFVLCGPHEMDAIRARIEAEVLRRDPRDPGNLGVSGRPDSRIDQSRHIDSEVIWQICSHPAIVARVACLLGPDLMLWRSNLWNKEPARGDEVPSLEIPWHQDWFYWSIEPMLSITAWVAIDAASIESSCVQILPGSHRAPVPHVPAQGMHFKTMADPRFVDARRAVNMELRPGELFLFNERTLHRSPPNRSGARRLGLSARITTPFVRVSREEGFADHPMLMVAGEDRFGFNAMGTPPGDPGRPGAARPPRRRGPRRSRAAG